MNRFIDFYQKHTKTITESRLTDERVKMIEVRGMYDDTDGLQDNVPITKKAIMGDVMNGIVLQDKQIQKIDLALEKIMKNGSNTSNKDDDEDEDDSDYDGNDWND